MMDTTKLQWTISKTKKRLSDSRWSLASVSLLLAGLLCVLAFSMRTLTLTWAFDVIKAQAPVMHVRFEDPVEGELAEASSSGGEQALERSTPVIVLAQDAFYFGDLNAMSGGFGQVRNKYKLAHRHGSPQVGELVKQLRKWQRQRELQFHIPPSSFAVLVPGSQWPMAVVMQVIHYLKTAPLFEKVVLASGFHA